MSCFTAKSSATAINELDPTKHVNYTSGMILGVDDFTQEFAYLSGRDRWLARDLLGYGTISGLSVRVETDGQKGQRVMIAPGVAVNPRGQFICVSAAQCAYLNEWLAANEKELKKILLHIPATSPPISSPPVSSSENLRLFVVLCYRDCPTDKVPIPGEPCRSEDELTAPSRIKDDFQLELRFQPPKQREEDAVRDFVDWLRQINVTDGTASSTPLDDFLQAIRDAASASLNPSSPPQTSPPNDFMFGSPPASLQILPGDVCEYMRAAFRLWVTELRHLWSERGSGCCVETTSGKNPDDCVLLAELNVPVVAVSSGWKVSDTEEIIVDEKNRPFVLHLRMLQEWLLCGKANFSPVDTPVTSPPHTSPPHTSPPVGEPPAPPAPKAHSDLTGLENDDHPQYLLVDPASRALTADLNADSHRISNLAGGEANGEAVIFEQAVKNGDTAAGDLSGTYPNPNVVRLQGNPVAKLAPKNGNLLTWSGKAWIPQSFYNLPLATINRIQANVYEIWFNIDAPGNLAQITKFQREHLRVFIETEPAIPERATFLEEIKIDATGIRQSERNIFLVVLGISARTELRKARFQFDIGAIGVNFQNRDFTLAQYAFDNNIRFNGNFTGQRDETFVTIFVRGIAPLT